MLARWLTRRSAEFSVYRFDLHIEHLILNGHKISESHSFRSVAFICPVDKIALNTARRI